MEAPVYHNLPVITNHEMHVLLQAIGDFTRHGSLYNTATWSKKLGRKLAASPLSLVFTHHLTSSRSRVRELMSLQRTMFLEAGCLAALLREVRASQMPPFVFRRLFQRFIHLLLLDLRVLLLSLISLPG